MRPPFAADEEIFCEPVESSLGQQISFTTCSQNQSASPPAPVSTQSQAAGPPSAQVPIQNSAKLELILPAVYTSSQKGLVRVSNEMQTFLKEDLDVSRLNEIHQHLWLAGLERPARPLHTQITLGRDIFVSEQADLHLLWTGTRIYVKPLPDFLLSHEIWRNYICKDQDLFEKASGFLLSYLWLVQRKCDLLIAHEKGLVSSTIEWRIWTKFVNSTVSNIDHSGKENINIRYRRGELRLNRINWIYRLCSRTRSSKSLFRGYLSSYHNYGTFLERNLSWLTASIIYVAVALTAMQVGLATNRLKSSGSFQRASYGFAIFSILAPLISLFIVSTVTLTLIMYNWNYAIKSKRTYNVNVIDVSKH